MPSFATIEEAQTWVAQDLRRMVAHGANIRGYTHVPAHHWQMADFLTSRRGGLDCLPWMTRTAVIMGQRLLAKSWLGARQYLKYRWRRCPWAQAIIHSSNDGMAKRFVAATKEELRVDPLMQDLLPLPSTSDFEFNLAGVQHEQGASIVAAGIKASLVGSRADIYIFDDPEPDTEPESLHERILQAFGEAGDILHDPGRHLMRMDEAFVDMPGIVSVPERTQIVVLGQPHWTGTAYLPRPEDFEEGAEGHPLVDARFLVLPGLRPNGEFRWPEMMAKKYFNWQEGRAKTAEEVKRSMPLSRWELQHMINTDYMIGAGPVLRLKEIEGAMKNLALPIMVVDPADSESGCEWGICVGGLFSRKIHISHLSGLFGEAFEGDDWESLGQSSWRQVFDIAHEYGVKRVYLESNLKAAASACRRYVAKTNEKVVVEEYRARRSKKHRIPEILEQPVNNRMVSCNPGVIQDRENRRQMAKLQWDKLPRPNDRLDALAGLVEILIEEPHLFAYRPPGMGGELIGGASWQTPYDDVKLPASYSRITTIARTPFERIH